MQQRMNDCESKSTTNNSTMYICIQCVDIIVRVVNEIKLLQTCMDPSDTEPVFLLPYNLQTMLGSQMVVNFLGRLLRGH